MFLRYGPCQIFFILGYFLPFDPLTAWKMKTSKKWKKSLEISSFYTSLLKIMILCYTAPEIWCWTDVIVIFHFGLFFALLPPKQLEKQKFLKNEKKTLEISFYTCVPNIMIRWSLVPEIWCTTDRQKDVGEPEESAQ